MREKALKTDVTSKKLRHCNTYSDLRSKYFFKKKYVSTSPRPGAHVGERNLFISRIRRSNRIKWHSEGPTRDRKGSAQEAMSFDMYEALGGAPTRIKPWAMRAMTVGSDDRRVGLAVMTN